MTVQTFFRSRPVLLVAFAFAIMADPVSSVAYAIESGLRALNGDLALLLPTMAVVLAIIVLVSFNYHQLYARFPEGGGDAAASARAFSEPLALVPLASLIVDYGLTITISVAAGASAIIAYIPHLAPWRVPIALSLLVVVAGLTWFGHGGRSIFSLMTLAFVAVSLVVIVAGLLAPSANGSGQAPAATAVGGPPLAVLLAFPVGMALATGVEAPSSAIAQLMQLDLRARVRFARITVWTMVAIVVGLTVGLVEVSTRLRVGLPQPNSTQVAEIALAATGHGAVYAAFQLTTSLLLLAAASSSFQAGPGLLKALASGGGGIGILPRPLSATNRHHTPYWGVAVFLGVAGALVVIAGGEEQRLVLFYAVAVFLAFLCGLLSMTKFFYQERRWVRLVLSATGALAVAVTLGSNIARGYPIVSIGVALAMAVVFYILWTRAGRPSGIAQIEAIGQSEPLQGGRL
jgi:amino acid permease-like protein